MTYLTAEAKLRKPKNIGGDLSFLLLSPLVMAKGMKEIEDKTYLTAEAKL